MDGNANLANVAIIGSVTVDGIPRDIKPHGRPADYQLLFTVLAKHLQPEHRKTIRLPMALRWTRVRTWDDLARISCEAERIVEDGMAYFETDRTWTRDDRGRVRWSCEYCGGLPDCLPTCWTVEPVDHEHFDRTYQQCLQQYGRAGVNLFTSIYLGEARDV